MARIIKDHESKYMELCSSKKVYDSICSQMRLDSVVVGSRLLLNDMTRRRHQRRTAP